jgi:hypothetical protein
MGKLPIDFEQKVKMPPPVGGRGYPYQLSAKDLMDNFNHLLKLIESLDLSGTGLPEGALGVMLYHDGDDWVLLANPGAPTAGTRNVLLHNGTAPVWTALAEEELQICGGTITVLKL